MRVPSDLHFAVVKNLVPGEENHLLSRLKTAANYGVRVVSFGYFHGLKMRALILNCVNRPVVSVL